MPKIRKPWCIPFSIRKVGKVEEESKSVAWVRFGEKPKHYASAFEQECLRRFETLEEAIKKYAEMNGMRLRDAAEAALMHFPSEQQLKRRERLRQSNCPLKLKNTKRR